MTPIDTTDSRDTSHATESVARLADPGADRLVALDWLRGLVMVLMTIDHADATFDRGHLLTDTAAIYRPGMPLPVPEFLTRFLTHLCAPTFLFLAGTSLALALHKRRARGQSERDLDRYLLTRGLLLMALDPLWMWWAFGQGGSGIQVLFAIGAALCCMIPLRRLPARWLLAFGLSWFVLGEALTGLVLHLGGADLAAGQMPGFWTALWFTGGALDGGAFLVIYPILPWLAFMALGWWFGGFLLDRPENGRSVSRVLLLWGVASLLVFALVRGIDGYGNMVLHRDDGSLVQWLHVSKYPPSLAFAALELGLMALCLAALFRLPRNGSPRRDAPLLVFGQTALFFYLIHVHLLSLGALLFGGRHELDLRAAWVATFVALGVLYPLCRGYRALKARHPRSLLRFI